MVRRLAFTLGLVALSLVLAAPALACGGLIGPRGSVNLLRTATLAAYHNGIEHYVTSFTFTGVGGGKFGSLVPLPGPPTKVERGGSWTLQRLEREVAPRFEFADAGAKRALARSAPARVILEVRIDALDITVLEGGAVGVGKWAEQNGFDLPPDAPEVLEFYARRSPYFMAARFNAAAARARGVQAGDGTPIHLTIPTSSPWVPLRILALGKQPAEQIDADVFLLTDRAPSMLPSPVGIDPRGRPIADGLRLERSERASDSLLADLRSDKGMEWMPRTGMWLTFLKLDAAASRLGYDLAIDASGADAPSWVAAGFPFGVGSRSGGSGSPVWVTLFAIAAAALALQSLRRRAPAAV